MKSEVALTIKNNLLKRSAEIKEGVRSDIRTCLVVQGGGMRASYSMGCLHALEDLGFTDSFDCVVGSSAGAINGAYFLSKQAKLATGVYQNFITNLKFINPLRFWKVLDVNYLIGIFSKGENALDKERLLATKTDLFFGLVNYPSGEECFLSLKENPDEVMNMIKASACIPAISNEKAKIKDKKYIDGMVIRPVPLRFAIESGYTDIVLVLTQPKSYKLLVSRRIYKFLSSTYFGDWPKKVRDSVFERFSAFNDEYKYVWSQEGDHGKYRVLIISPNKNLAAKRLSISKKRVLENIRGGYQDTLSKFS